MVLPVKRKHSWRSLGRRVNSRKTAHQSTYNVWQAMLQRCLNPTQPNYRNYGARGISVCDRWLVYTNFLEDMGERPDGLSLDRIDNDGNYEPDNCRWATAAQQVRNSRHCRFFEFQGRKQTLADWADERGLNRSTVYKRINRSGWTIEEALGL
jgi:hypothetical protein